MILLLVAGIGFLLAGILAIVFGIPVKEFGFGNTLILSGAVAIATGAILLGIHAAVRELQATLTGGRTSLLRPAKLSAPSAGEIPTDAGSTTGTDGFLFARDRTASEQPSGVEAESTAASESSLAPWQEEAAARDRSRQRGASPPADAVPPPVEPPVKPRRNLLFSSSSRKERERAAKSSDTIATESDRAPMTAPAPEPVPRTFDEAWPESGRAQSDPAARRGRIPSPSTETSEAAPERAVAAAQTEDAPKVTVLKSGVVDGMAYSLYSDGSIEAQMPEGMMRFASIDELRAHLDQRP